MMSKALVKSHPDAAQAVVVCVTGWEGGGGGGDQIINSEGV